MLDELQELESSIYGSPWYVGLSYISFLSAALLMYFFLGDTLDLFRRLGQNPAYLQIIVFCTLPAPVFIFTSIVSEIKIRTFYRNGDALYRSEDTATEWQDFLKAWENSRKKISTVHLQYVVVPVIVSLSVSSLIHFGYKGLFVT